MLQRQGGRGRSTCQAKLGGVRTGHVPKTARKGRERYLGTQEGIPKAVPLAICDFISMSRNVRAPAGNSSSYFSRIKTWRLEVCVWAPGFKGKLSLRTLGPQQIFENPLAGAGPGSIPTRSSGMMCGVHTSWGLGGEGGEGEGPKIPYEALIKALFRGFFGSPSPPPP